MCTYINQQADISGSGKGAGGWFPLARLTVAFDHPVSAQLGHAVLIDFQNPDIDAGNRVALELDIASAAALVAELQQTIDEAVRSGLAELTAPPLRAPAAARRQRRYDQGELSCGTASTPALRTG
jgi:hypothetical protein